MSPLFGPKYDDERLCLQGEHALAEDPILNAAHLDVSSEKGVVTLRGRAPTQVAKTRAEEAVRHAYDLAGLKYDRIVDEIVVGEQVGEGQTTGAA